MKDRIRSLITKNKRELRFFLLFVLYFCAAQTLYYFLAPIAAPFMQETLNAKVGGWLVQILSPSEQIHVVGCDLVGPNNGSLRIGTGCDGIGGMLLLASAILAYPAPWIRRIIGVVGGIAALYGVNLLRIAALYFSWQYAPKIFEVMHVYVGQGFIIFTAVLFFILWIGVGRGQNE